ncbi:MAG: hypothetical protein V4601_05930 [Pseudomonadota bacterium]
MKLAKGLLLCWALLSGGARAQDVSPESDPVLSNPAFIIYARANLFIGKMLADEAAPSLKDPVYAQQVSHAFDVSVLEALKDVPYANFSGVCFLASSTQGAYLVRGVKRSEFDPWAIQPRLKQNVTPETIKLKKENYLRFQDELLAALGFGLACRAQQLEKLESHLPQMGQDDLVVFRLGFPDFQNGLAELVSYHAAALRDPVRPEVRRGTLDLLLESAGAVAGGMTRQTRRSTAQAIAKVITGPGLSPEERSDLKKVQQALARPDCGRVCSFK